MEIMERGMVGQMAGVELVRRTRRTVVEELTSPHGKFIVEHWRNGKRINEYRFPNAITNEGANKLLNVMFDGGTPVTTWWVGLIDSTSYTAMAATDDYADINQTNNGWKEFTNYTDTANSGSSTTRPAWAVAHPPAGQ